MSMFDEAHPRLPGADELSGRLDETVARLALLDLGAVQVEGLEEESRTVFDELLSHMAGGQKVLELSRLAEQRARRSPFLAVMLEVFITKALRLLERFALLMNETSEARERRREIEERRALAELN